MTTAIDKASAFGITAQNTYGFSDWVGGRYSLGSPVGMSLMLAIGPEHFRDMLDGFASVDKHFRTAPLAENLPVLLALIGIWHVNVRGADTHAVLPYSQDLARFPAYLQQLDMESNGKGVDLAGRPLTVASGPIVWGEPGRTGSTRSTSCCTKAPGSFRVTSSAACRRRTVTRDTICS